jgi:type I restriction enzyme R subunit
MPSRRREAIAEGKRDMLVGMATGTGKTRLALCLIYRLLKAGRFRRILFLVDRTALGDQALDAFTDVRLENLQTLTEIYDVKGLGDLKPEPDTRCTSPPCRAWSSACMYAGDDDEPVPVDAYDCLVMDECHRGYALDMRDVGHAVGLRGRRAASTAARRTTSRSTAACSTTSTPCASA